MNKKAQQVLSGIIIVMLVVTVFSIGFMTESMEVKDRGHRSWSGLDVVSGMAVLDTVVNSVAEGENAMAVSAKDGSFYIIRKRGDRWYYSDTTVKVDVNHMDAGFRYYLISEVPDYVEVNKGAPFFNKITGMATGMEGVSGFVVKKEPGIYNEKWEKLDNTPLAGTPYIEIKEPRSDGVVTRVDHKKDGGTKTLWIDSSKTQWQTSSVPSLKKTSNYVVNLGGTYVDLGDYSSKQDAIIAAKTAYGISDVRKQSTTAVSGTKYYAYLADGRVVPFNADDASAASTKGDTIASKLGTSLTKTEPQKFKVKDKTGYEVVIEAPSSDVAKTIVQTKYGMVPVDANPISHEANLKTKEYLIKTNKGTYSIQADTDEKAKEKGTALAKARGETFISKETRFTFEEFKTQNPQIKDMDALNKIYNGKYGAEAIKKEEEEKTIPPMEIKGKDGESLGWWFNGKSQTKEEADKAHTKLLQEQYAEKALKDLNEELKGGAKVIGVDETDRQLAKKGDDIYYFDTVAKEFKKFEEASYTLKETIGKDGNAVEVIRTFETKTSEQTEIKVETQDGKVAWVDEETINRIKNAEKSDLNFEIVKGIGVTKLPKEEPEGGVHIDATGDRWAKCPSGDSRWCKVDDGGKYVNIGDQSGDEVLLAKSWEDIVKIRSVPTEQIMDVEPESGIYIDATGGRWKNCPSGTNWCKVDSDGEFIWKDLVGDQVLQAKSWKDIAKTKTVPTEQILEFTDKKTGKLKERHTLSVGYTSQEGTKTTEQFRTAYFYEGNEISAKKAEELEKKAEKEGKDIEIQTMDILGYKETKEKEEGEVKYLTTYDLKMQYGKDKKWTQVYEATKFDVEKGELTEFTYGEMGEDGKPTKWVTMGEDGEIVNSNNADPDFKKRAESARKQYKSRQFFSTLDFALKEFKGLGYYATWFMDDEDLEEWRESVDKFFAEAYLGTEYWVSAICSSKIDRDQKGVAYVDTTSGLAGVAAHIEATRSGAITNTTATQYLYKITFNVKNGDWDKDPKALEEMEFNIYVEGERTAQLLRQTKKLKKGESFGRTRGNAVVQYSGYKYNRICIKFKEAPSFWSLDKKDLCNEIQGPKTKAEKVEEAGTTGGQETAAGSEFLQI